MEEFTQLWRARFGAEAQPPERIVQLAAQDVGIELDACVMRVQALQTELRRELFVLNWLRSLETQLGVQSRDGKIETPQTCSRHSSEGKETSKSVRALGASRNHSSECTNQRLLEAEQRNTHSLSSRSSSCVCSSTQDRTYSSGSQVSRRKSESDLESTVSSGLLAIQPQGGSGILRPPEVWSELSGTQHNKTERETQREEEADLRKRFIHKVNKSDHSVARVVSKKLSEGGKHWSSDLQLSEPGPSNHPSSLCQRRSISEPALVPCSQLMNTYLKHTQVVSSRENCANSVTKEPSTESQEIFNWRARGSEVEAVHSTPNEAGAKGLIKVTPKESIKEQYKAPQELSRPRTVSQESKGSSEISISLESSIHSNSFGSRESLLEEDSSFSRSRQRRSTRSSIKAKLNERRKSGGWKVIEVSGSPRKVKPEQEESSLKSKADAKRGSRAEQNNTANLNKTIVETKNIIREDCFSRNTKALSNKQMFKAAKEKLSQMTSSPPIQRRPSREKEKRRSHERNPHPHRTSNGQLETQPKVVEEVMVERRVEKNDSLLSEIMAHRFSNGLDGSQLLERGEHPLVMEESSKELPSDRVSGTTASAITVTPADTATKVTLRRRSGRDSDSLPDAKRRSSYLEDDDCVTPKEELVDDGLQQGITMKMVQATTAQSGSESPVGQESLESSTSLTPSNSLQGNINYRMSYMTAVRENPQMTFSSPLPMPLIDEVEGREEDATVGMGFPNVMSDSNLQGIDLAGGLEDSMELDDATISVVTLSNDFFDSRSGSVTSLPEDVTTSATEDALSSSVSESSSPPKQAVVNLRQTVTSGVKRKNRRRMGNAELDQTGASLEEMFSSGPMVPNNKTSPRLSPSPAASSLSEDACLAVSSSPSDSSFFPLPHLKETEPQSSGTSRSSRVYPVRRSTVVVQGEKLVIRKLVVAGIVSAEKSYIDCLHVMKEFYRKPLLALATTTQPILTEKEINTIFYRTEDMSDLHTQLHEKLEPQLRDWNVNTCVGDFFVELCKNLKLYKDYVEFYSQSLQCLEKSKIESAQFKKFLEDVRATVMTHYKEVPRINELLRRPIERLQSYSLVLNDLCQHTPEDHVDYSVLRQSLHAMSAFIASTHDPQSFSKLSGGYNREMVKESLMVELSEGIRKVRRVFLFHDVIVSSKQKPTRTGMKFELKWFLPLSELTFHPLEESPEAHRPVPATSDMELSVMRNRIAELKAQIGKDSQEYSGLQPERDGSFRRGRGGIRAIYTMKSNRAERFKKKLQEQQVSYWMAFPSLPLRLYGEAGKQYVFLLHTEQERENWISSIKKLQPKAVRPRSIHPLELQDLLNHQTITELKKIEEVTLPVLEDEYLSGVLRVRVMSAMDLKAKPVQLYCCLEFDEYGKFERKAKTQPSQNDPTTLSVTWDQDFELEVVGAHIVKVTVCTKQLLKEETCAHGKIRLPIHELRSNKRHKSEIKLVPQGSVQLIIEYYSSGASRDRKPALLSSGVFGVPIEVVAKRERHDIPLIVETCVEEVERRGMTEVGIYRVAGVLRDVSELRDAFDTDYLKAQVIAFEADIHAVAGLLKKYFRELPDPLFTNALYLSFVQGMGLSDPEARDQCLITLLYSLPPVNFKTAIFLFKHLRRVAANSSSNKMNLNNLATLFGPNLLRPAPLGQEESLLSMAAVDVATPVNVLMYFLSCPEEYLDEAQVQTSPVSTASTGRGRRRDSRRKLTWIEEEDGVRSSVRSSRRNSGRNSQT